MAKKKKTGSGQYPLRLPNDLRDRIASGAKSRDVSINAEILERLERSFEKEERLGGPKVVELLETIASVMKLTGQHAGFFESGKPTNRGEWLSLPYAFDQATKAAITILEHHRPLGKIVVPEPDVVAVGGRPGTKIEQKETVARMFQLFAELGPLIAAGELKKREQDDE